jgi:hypothetical protein
VAGKILAAGMASHGGSVADDAKSSEHVPFLRNRDVL